MGFRLDLINDINKLLEIYDSITCFKLQKLSANDGILPFFDNEPNLNPEDFKIKKGAATVTVSGNARNHLTYYGAEKNRKDPDQCGTVFHNKPTSTGPSFDAYGSTIAMNPNLEDLGFHLGDYVLVQPDGKDSFVLQITDIKGTRYTTDENGNKVKNQTYFDFNKEAFYNLGVNGSKKVTFTQVVPNDCNNIKTSSKHPMARCYPERVMLLFSTSEKAYAGRNYAYNDSDIKNINFQAWALEYFIEKYNIPHDFELPATVQMRRDSSAGEYYYWVSSLGYFKDEKEAKQFLNNLCEPSGLDAALRDSSDAAYINDNFCQEPVVMTSAWPGSAKKLIYTKNTNWEFVQDNENEFDLPPTDPDQDVVSVNFQFSSPDHLNKAENALGEYGLFVPIEGALNEYTFIFNKDLPKNMDPEMVVAEFINDMPVGAVNFSFNSSVSQD